jgi:hypothetical protein
MEKFLNMKKIVKILQNIRCSIAEYKYKYKQTQIGGVP